MLVDEEEVARVREEPVTQAATAGRWYVYRPSMLSLLFLCGLLLAAVIALAAWLVAELEHARIWAVADRNAAREVLWRLVDRKEILVFCRTAAPAPSPVTVGEWRLHAVTAFPVSARPPSLLPWAFPDYLNDWVLQFAAYQYCRGDRTLGMETLSFLAACDSRVAVWYQEGPVRDGRDLKKIHARHLQELIEKSPERAEKLLRYCADKWDGIEAALPDLSEQNASDERH